MGEYEVVAEESYKELLNLLEWCSLFGPIPTLVGGWAVFVYNSYFGSVDIDLVGPSMGGRFLDIVERYERVHGYQEVKTLGLGVESAYRKSIVKEGKFYGYVEIDVCTYESDVGSFHEAPDRKLPYGLCDDPKLRRKVTFNEKRTVYVPRKPLLFLYKLKALRDRTFDFKTRGAIMSAERREWILSKLEKDGSDLIALLDQRPQRYIVKERFNFGSLKQLIEKHDLHFTLESVKELPNMKRSLERQTNIDRKTVERWVKTLLKKLS